jgi:hypothetical protein
MAKPYVALAFLLVTLLGCDRSGLNTKAPTKGGQSGSPASGGTFGSGGSGSGEGGVGTGGTGGSYQNSGGNPAGGVYGTGGSISSGGHGGSNAGGSVTGGTIGTGGTSCPPIFCPAYTCPEGTQSRLVPCSCPICEPSDAGTAKDVTSDGCVPVPCALPKCSDGYQLVNPPCGCPTCVPIDAGSETAQPDCTALDECSCLTSSHCRAISQACYCPQCSGSVVCKCGGGKFVGCASPELATCTNAQARVAALCPQLADTSFSKVCDQSASECVTRCLNEVTSCDDIFCTFCEACDCATDSYYTCLGNCKTALGNNGGPSR